MSDFEIRPDVAYYYPAPFWGSNENGWVKSLLLFFDKISILLPGYMYGRHHLADPSLAEPLENMGLLEVLEPSYWVDEDTARSLADAILGLLAEGVFDDLNREEYFHELSQSRIGYSADVELAECLVEELRSKGLARPSDDGVSIPLHPIVRTTILVILAQLARSAGNKRNLSIHPTTHKFGVIEDLVRTLSRERMPSRDKVIALDLEAVSFDLDPVPLDELLHFREEHRVAHRTYMRDLRGLMVELAEMDDERSRDDHLLRRRQELADAAHDLQRSGRIAFTLSRPSMLLGIAGTAWSASTGDPVGAVLAAAGLIAGISESNRAESRTVTAYSYLYQVGRTFAPRTR